MVLVACSPSGSDAPDRNSSHGANGISEEIARSEAAGKMARQDPLGALDLCGALSDIRLKNDCILSTAPLLARKDAEAAKEVCASLSEPEECFFRLGETLRDPSLCARSGAFEDNCRLHVLSFGLRQWLSEDQSAAQIEAAAPEHILSAGMTLEDSRPWTAIWRWALSRSTPLDRMPCKTLSDPLVSEACMHAGVGLFHDQLSQARDRGVEVCSDPLPEALRYTSDPQLDHALERRRATDLCDPAARRVAPDASLPGSAP